MMNVMIMDWFQSDRPPDEWYCLANEILVIFD